MTTLDESLRLKLLESQKNELTESAIYEKLAESMRDSHNKEILKTISEEEIKHYNTWKRITGEEVQPKRLRV